MKQLEISLYSTKTLIGRALVLALYSTLSNQHLLEKHLLNTNILQMLSDKCSHMKLLE